MGLLKKLSSPRSPLPSTSKPCSFSTPNRRCHPRPARGGRKNLHVQDMAGVSPHGNHLGSLTVPVYLLHGEGDNIIPASETLWMASELPDTTLQSALISPVLSHLDLDGAQPSAADRWRLVHFFALILRAAHHFSFYHLRIEVPAWPHSVAAATHFCRGMNAVSHCRLHARAHTREASTVSMPRANHLRLP